MYPQISSIHEETGERVIFVRGKVSKKYNSMEVWLRLTRERRNKKKRDFRKRNLEKVRAREKLSWIKYKDKCKKWEIANAKRRKSPRRKLFNKLRRIGVPMNEARKQAQWY